MPYVITVKRPDDDDRNCDCHIPALEGAGQHSPGCACFKPRVVSRLAVATLEEARDYGVSNDSGAWSNEPPTGPRPDDWQAAVDAVLAVPGSGGTITLPDGTEIKVVQATWYALARDASHPWARRAEHVGQMPPAATRTKILAAYNAKWATA